MNSMKFAYHSIFCFSRMIRNSSVQKNSGVMLNFSTLGGTLGWPPSGWGPIATEWCSRDKSKSLRLSVHMLCHLSYTFSPKLLFITAPLSSRVHSISVSLNSTPVTIS